MTLVPYKALYKLPQRALAALRAYLALSTGTTSCGPATDDISSSTPAVSIIKLSFSLIKYSIDFKKLIYSLLLKSLSLLDLCQSSIFFCILSLEYLKTS